MEIDRYLQSSTKITIDDLDWAEARAAGLREDERFILTYFGDIESQTIVYLRDFLRTKTALDPEVTGFLTMWNYEEYFHGRAIAELLDRCGYPLEENRLRNVRERSLFSEQLEAALSSILSRVFAADFPTVYMTWGAIQEVTTLRGYERIHDATANPALRELTSRIAKQERRHYAWYNNSAREGLERSPRARKLTRFLLERFWTPVGAGVKTEAEVFRLMSLLFPGEHGDAMAADIDAKVGTLPGLEGLKLMAPYLERSRRGLRPLVQAVA
jgi:rubrerythrin